MLLLRWRRLVLWLYPPLQTRLPFLPPSLPPFAERGFYSFRGSANCVRRGAIIHLSMDGHAFPSVVLA